RARAFRTVAGELDLRGQRLHVVGELRLGQIGFGKAVRGQMVLALLQRAAQAGERAAKYGNREIIKRHGKPLRKFLLQIGTWAARLMESMGPKENRPLP